MDFYLLLLRLIHILGGVFWAGSVFMLTGFVGPAVSQAGPAGGKFMQRLVLGTRFTTVTAVAAGLTVLTGLLMYLRKLGVLGNFSVDWVSTGEGIVITIGGLAGIAALIAGALTGSTSQKLAELGASLEGPPSPEQASEIAGLQNRLSDLGVTASILLVVALISMATARYVFF
ncbi:MAG: hypothetical protein BMS9Abin28_2621 [Anaerolineae bacterium]|nr:MAG: hypothetical protein BMS9Abin28_2621 [Anaerolineae bacterium]